MLILILIDIQYSEKAVFSFEKNSICQNHSSSGSLNLLKNLLPPPPPPKPQNTPPPPPPPPPFYGYFENLASVAKEEFQFVPAHKSHEFANYVNKDFETNKQHGIENLI